MNLELKGLFDKITEDHIKYENQSYNSNILIIDGLNSYIRNWTVSVEMNEDGLHVGGVTGFLKSLGLAIRTVNPTRVIVVFDGKGGSARRKKMYEGYKANRGTGSRLNRKYNWSSEDEEAKQKIAQLTRLVEYLKILPITLIVIDNIEADDVIGYICRTYQDLDEIQKINILSTDKDFYQLINDKVNIFHPMKKICIDKKYVVENFKVSPNNFLLLKGLIGDSSDNIKGIPGLGVKTVNKLFPYLESDTKYSVDDIISECNSLIGTKEFKKVHQTIIDNRGVLEKNILLMTLAEKNMSGNAKLACQKYFKSFPKKASPVNLYQMLSADKIITVEGYAFFKNNFIYINSFID